MKALNYFASLLFLILAIVSVIVAILIKQYHGFFIVIISGVISIIAWKDYKKCKREEEL